MKTHPHNFRRSRGFSIIEALVAAMVLAVGMLALAALQSQLVKASAFSKTQSAALSIAMDRLEELRAYRDPSQWLAITDVPATAGTFETVTRSVGGQTFTFERRVDVERFRYRSTPSPAGFVSVPDGDAMNGNADFKRAEVTVRWTTADNEQREVRLSDIYSSLMPGDSGLLVARPASGRRDPPVRIYTPSEPGIIPIAIGDDQASASSNPKPVQFDSDGGATLTRFNVQTYVNDGGTNPLLQRRIEYSVAACQCRATNQVSSDTNPLYEPTVWTGDRYSSPRVMKNRPMATAVQQINDNQDVNRFDDICTACCRDHQNSDSSVNARTAADADPTSARPYNVDPFRDPSEYDGEDGVGPMKRYVNANPTVFSNMSVSPNQPVLNVAGSNAVWLETCRLVRVDGINRVATDARLENYTVLNMDPTARTSADSSLASLPSAVVTKYGVFAKEYVEQALGIDTDTTPPDTTVALPTNYPVGGLDNALIQSAGPPVVYSALANTYDQTELTRAFLDLNGDDAVQLQNSRYHNLHARGIYIDFLTTEAKQALACVGSTARTCLPFRNKNPLELVPFFAINLTNLTYWRRPDPPAIGPAPAAKLDVSPNGFPQTYGDNFIRGRVQAIADGDELVRGSSRRGNEGLTDQIPTYRSAVAAIVDEPEPFRVTGNNAQTYRFRVQMTCPTCANNDQFFLKMGQKQLTSSPDGAFCSDTGDQSVRECSLGDDPNVTSVNLTFAKYVAILCYTQGSNKGTFNPATGNCEKGNGNNVDIVPAEYTLNYKFCGLTNVPALANSTLVSAGTPDGTWSEAASATMSASTGLGTLLGTSLPSSTTPTGPINAVFVREGDTCPI